MTSNDKDFRFMATNDLMTELQKDSIKLDDDSERKVGCSVCVCVCVCELQRLKQYMYQHSVTHTHFDIGSDKELCFILQQSHWAEEHDPSRTSLTLVMLNKLRCHAHFQFSANLIT